MTPSRLSFLLATAACGAAVASASPASAAPPSRACGPDANLVSFSDALDKTTFDGTDVGGLSALAFPSLSGGRGRAQALVDNQGDTPARIYDLAGGATPRVTGITRLTRADGTPYTGADFDGEGLVVLPDDSLLVSSESEPSIRRFDPSGRQIDELEVPARFGVAPAGEATRNQTFEGLGASVDGRTVWAAMEGPLEPDGATAEGGNRLRFLRYARERGGGYVAAGQIGYAADPGLSVTEVQVVNRFELLVLERGFVPGQGNTVRVYQAYLTGADDVTDAPTLGDPQLQLAGKRLLVDLERCPSLGATSPGTQANPLLDNVEGMVLGARERGTGYRELRLLSDDNFSAGQVTRYYRLRVALRGEPVLEARATYDALEFQPGPPSGQVGVSPANGVTPPFASQPIPGFSALLFEEDGTLLGMPDNGFGAKGNSADFLLRVYRLDPDYRTASGGSGRFDVDGFVSLRDPDRRIPFPIVNDATSERLLTGADFDLESLQRGADGTLWFGEEFGPFLLNTSADGRVLRAPVALPGVKSPQSPDLAPGEIPNLPPSRGFEATAASPDGRYLYPILEGALTTETDQTVRRVYEFDTTLAAYTGESWSLKLRNPNHVVGDAQVLEGRRLVSIERDNAGGPAAAVKRLVEVDLDADPLADGTQPTRPFMDLLRIRDPRGISLPAPAGAFGLGDPFEFPFVSVESVLPLGRDRYLITNDNNFPGNDGRIPGQPDDIELIIVRGPR